MRIANGPCYSEKDKILADLQQIKELSDQQPILASKQVAELYMLAKNLKRSSSSCPPAYGRGDN